MFCFEQGKDSLGKFYAKVGEGIFLEYSQAKLIGLITKDYLLLKSGFTLLLMRLTRKILGKVFLLMM